MLQLNIIPLFWRLHKMNKNKLQREGQKWVHDGIITEQQLNAILDNYVKRNPSYIFITFAVLFISIGVLLFIFSDWTLISRSEEHTSELQSRGHLVCRLLLE